MEPIIVETMNDIINRVDAREWRRVNEWGHRAVRRYKREKAKNESMKDDWQVATEKIAQENSDLHHDIKCLKVRHREKIDEIHHQNLSLSNQCCELKKENQKLKESSLIQWQRADKYYEQIKELKEKLELLEKIREQDTYSIKRLEKLNLENKCSRCAPWRG